MKRQLNALTLQEIFILSRAIREFYPCKQSNSAVKILRRIIPLVVLLTVDLNDQLGNTVSSGKLKLCFFLSRKGLRLNVGGGNAHEPEELRAFMFPKMEAFCRQQRENAIIKKLSSLAQQSILTEISLTPKPGLVDKFSNGSHFRHELSDFYINSTTAISPWFEELVREGFALHDRDLTKALPLLRRIGLQMESAMYEATNHVNTQKGIIFLMGLSLFACGILFKRGHQFDIESFRAIIRAVCVDLVKHELVDFSGARKSHGETIFQKYGFSGARGEAETAFQTVFEYGLPLLSGVSNLQDEILIKSFLAIASVNDDTNIIYRSDPDRLVLFKQKCSVALENFNERNYSDLIDFCKTNNISPGGSADLLAVTIFVWLVMKNDWLG